MKKGFVALKVFHGKGKAHWNYTIAQKAIQLNGKVNVTLEGISS